MRMAVWLWSIDTDARLSYPLQHLVDIGDIIVLPLGLHGTK
jgi:hypothetical protein